MTKDEILADIQEIFRIELKLPELVLNLETTPEHIPQWDSLNHAVLVGLVRDHFKVKLKLSDVIKLKSIGDFCDLVYEEV